MTAKERKRLEWHAEHMKRLAEWPPEMREEWEERSAIMEHDGGMNRIDAESRAFLRVLERSKARREAA